MRIFLKLKHWQLFIIWILAEIIFLATSNTPIWILTIELFGFTIIGWMYSIGKVINGLNDKNKIQNYREDFWFFLYLISAIPFGYKFKTTDSYHSGNDLLIICAGIVGLISMIRLVNFSAKAYKQYNINKDLKFPDYLEEFIWIAFFIIGIWKIQPEINKIIDKK